MTKKKPIIILTHDLDSIWKPFSYIWERRHRFPEDVLRDASEGKNVYNNVHEVLALEEELGFKSTLFVPTQLFRLDPIIDTLQDFEKKGWELGLHYVHNNRMQVQKDLLEMITSKEVVGVRTHLLKPNSETQVHGRFLYDSSRWDGDDGTPIPIHQITFHAELGKETFTHTGRMWEIPISIMDADIVWGGEPLMWRYLTMMLQRKYEYLCVLFHPEAFQMLGGRTFKNFLWHLKDYEYEVVTCVEAIQQCQKK